MTRPVLALAAALGLMMFAPATCAAEPGKIDLETAELTTDLVGAPVFAADGKEIGRVVGVVDAANGTQGLPSSLQVETDANLGFGTRTVVVSDRLFTALQGAVVIDLPADAVRSLPETTHADE